jgi:lantibiotic modifying enzyme
VKRIGDVSRSSRVRYDARARARFLIELKRFAEASPSSSALAALCAPGVNYGWAQLEQTIAPRILRQTSARARASLKRYLQRRLEIISGPCFQLERRSFVLALDSLGLTRSSDSQLTERMFLDDRPGYRLESLFKKFPVLADLWNIAITQWRHHSSEVLSRAVRDRERISAFFFGNKLLGKIIDVRPGLSDPHHGGRSVTMVEFDRGRVIYKPRSPANELAWSSLLDWMNNHGLPRQLRAARILGRRRYYWMEWEEPSPCQSLQGVRRFYERMGETIAAAYLLKAVDCHRENVIAAGEFPILVDADALWHISAVTKTQSPSDLLYRTGFFPNSRSNSLQSRSSVLGGGSGSQLARFRNRPTKPANFVDEILRGFDAGWRCLIGSPPRRVAFECQVARVRAQKRRWIYCATEKYARILKMSLEPAALRSSAERARVVRRFCSRASTRPSVIAGEVGSLLQLDIPYFTRRIRRSMPRDDSTPPAELREAICQGLRWTNVRRARTSQVRQNK